MHACTPRPPEEDTQGRSLPHAGAGGGRRGPSQPRTATSAKGLSQRLHWRPMTPGLQLHWPRSMSQARLWEPCGKQSQGMQASCPGGL